MSREPLVLSGADGVAAACELLRDGAVVAFPTETVYGLGADATNPDAVARIFAIKGRPRDHPLIVHLGDHEPLTRWASDVGATATALAARFWPGPLTLVLTSTGHACAEVTGGRVSIALRVPAHPVALALLGAFAGGLAAPSANRFGRVSPTSVQHVLDDLGTDVDAILDGGRCEVGVESTIVELTGAQPAVLRHGGVSVEQLSEVLGSDLDATVSGPARAPGMREAHYAPRCAVRLAVDVQEAAQLAAQCAEPVRVLAPAVDAAVWAHELYEWLRQADRDGVATLVVVPPDAGGLGDAVRERLFKAAAGGGAASDATGSTSPHGRSIGPG
jgi:L-threonylcarbamoyladenylate synthase